MLIMVYSVFLSMSNAAERERERERERDIYIYINNEPVIEPFKKFYHQPPKQKI